MKYEFKAKYGVGQEVFYFHLVFPSGKAENRIKRGVIKSIDYELPSREIIYWLKSRGVQAFHAPEIAEIFTTHAEAKAALAEKGGK